MVNTEFKYIFYSSFTPKMCFHCRQPGHGVADCPQMLGDVEQGTGICYRCGSTEHDVSKCNAKVDKKLGEFECFT